jgi:glutathione synthase/RimK-type ligase-like ATP-grasp enzyme
MRIAFLSIEDLSNFVADDPLVIEPLRRLGHEAEFVPWQAAVEWRKFDGVVIRTTWDYQDHLPAFLRVLQEIETQTRLANPLEIVKWNADKKIYLQDIEKQGGRIVPTIWSDNKIDSRQIREWCEQLQTDELVIKPTIGANAQHTFRLKRGEADRDALSKVHEGRSYMVQPFMRGIVEEGEFSLFYFSGEYSHTILKTPKAGDFRVQEEHGGIIQTAKPPAELSATGEKIMNCVLPTPLYARVDFVRTEANEFLVVELELIEPSMYLRQAEHAPRMFAEAIDRWLLSERWLVPEVGLEPT